MRFSDHSNLQYQKTVKIGNILENLKRLKKVSGSLFYLLSTVHLVRFRFKNEGRLIDLYK